MLLAVMIKLMKVVWSEVAILVITLLSSDLSPAALLSQSEQQPASDGCGSDHSSNCAAVLNSGMKLRKANYPSSICFLAGMLNIPGRGVLISCVMITVRW